MSALPSVPNVAGAAAARRRSRLLIGVALLVGAWSGWITLFGEHDEVAAPATRRPVASRSARAPSAPVDDVCENVVMPRRGRLSDSVNSNPFGAMPPPPAPVSRVVVAVEVAPPPPPPLPEPPSAPALPPRPPLPYKYLGLLADPDGSRPQVFLLMGDKVLVARPGELLEGGFRLDSVGARELRFVWPSDNSMLRLGIDGA
jgi:hypothetical protein